MGSGYEGGGLANLIEAEEKDTARLHRVTCVDTREAARLTPTSDAVPLPLLAKRVALLASVAQAALAADDVHLLAVVLTAALQHQDTEMAKLAWEGLKDAREAVCVFDDETAAIDTALSTLDTLDTREMFDRALQATDKWPVAQLEPCLRRRLRAGALVQQQKIDGFLQTWLEEESVPAFWGRGSSPQHAEITMVEPQPQGSTWRLLTLLCDRHPEALRAFDVAPHRGGNSARPGGHPSDFGPNREKLVGALPEDLVRIGTHPKIVQKVLGAIEWPAEVLVRTLDTVLLMLTFFNNRTNSAVYATFAKELFPLVKAAIPGPKVAWAESLPEHIGDARAKLVRRRKTKVAWSLQHTLDRNIRTIPILLGVLRRLPLGRDWEDDDADLLHAIMGLGGQGEGWSQASLIALIEEALEAKNEELVLCGFAQLQARGEPLPSWWAAAPANAPSFLARVVTIGWDPQACDALPRLSDPPSGNAGLPPHQSWDHLSLQQALTMAVTMGDKSSVECVLAAMTAMDVGAPTYLPKVIKGDFEKEEGESSNQPRKRKADDMMTKDPFLTHVAMVAPTFLPLIFNHPPSKPFLDKASLSDIVIQLLNDEVRIYAKKLKYEAKAWPQSVASAANSLEIVESALTEFVLPPAAFGPDDLPDGTSPLLVGRLATLFNSLYAPPVEAGGRGGRGYEMTKTNFDAVA